MGVVWEGLIAATRSGAILPVLSGAALPEQGITRLLWAVGNLLPSAAERAPFVDAEGAETFWLSN